MAAPITTAGFQVSERLNPQFLDPRLLTPQYGAIMPAVSQGLDTAGRFAQIYENAQQRPIRQQLAQIQLEEAQARAAMRPMEMQLAELRLAEAQQQAAIPQQIVEQVDLVGGEPLSRSSRDIGAGLGNLEIVEGFTPRERITRGREVAAGGVVSPFERRETMASKAQVAAEAETQASRIRSAEALATQRARGKEFENIRLVELRDEAIANGDRTKAATYQSLIDAETRPPGLLQSGTTAARRLETIGTNAGFTMPEITELGRTSIGISAMQKLADARALRARGEFLIPPELTLSPDEEYIIERVRVSPAPEAGGGFSVLTNAASNLADGGDVPTLTVDEARQTIPSAPVGFIFIGTDGKRRQKNANGTVSIIQ